MAKGINLQPLKVFDYMFNDDKIWLLRGFEKTILKALKIHVERKSQ